MILWEAGPRTLPPQGATRPTYLVVSISVAIIQHYYENYYVSMIFPFSNFIIIFDNSNIYISIKGPPKTI